MIDAFITYIQSIVVEYGALGVFFASLIEQIIAPIPSPLIPIMAGFFLLPAHGFFWDVLWQSMFIIALPVAFGATIGSLILYFLGYLGGKPIIEKSKKWIGLNWEDLEKVKIKLNNSRLDESTLFILWALPIVPSTAIAVSCGIIRYPVFKYILITISGIFIRATIMSIVGWQAGELYYVNIERIAAIENYLLIGFGILILIGIGFLFYKNYKKKHV